MRGIILAGGYGTRLWPMTVAVSKQLLPVYDKPMIFYPLATLISSGCKEIAIITRADQDQPFIELLGDGSQFGVKLTYFTQAQPLGIPEAFLICEQWIGREPVTLILGDNLFFYDEQSSRFQTSRRDLAYVIAVRTAFASQYGVFRYTRDGSLTGIEEKPQDVTGPAWAMTGLYRLPPDVSKVARKLLPSDKGITEIVDLINVYRENRLCIYHLSRDAAWFDCGTPDSLLAASEFVKAKQRRSGLLVGCPFVAAHRNGWIDKMPHGNPGARYERWLAEGHF